MWIKHGRILFTEIARTRIAYLIIAWRVRASWLRVAASRSITIFALAPLLLVLVTRWLALVTMFILFTLLTVLTLLAFPVLVFLLALLGLQYFAMIVEVVFAQYRSLNGTIAWIRFDLFLHIWPTWMTIDVTVLAQQCQKVFPNLDCESPQHNYAMCTPRKFKRPSINIVCVCVCVCGKRNKKKEKWSVVNINQILSELLINYLTTST